MRRIASPFTTIRSEGALLPPELLARIAEADKDLGGLAPTEYHLGDTERLGEAIARSWNRLVGVWASFAPSLAGFNPNDPGVGTTRERWLAPLFQELGFGRLTVAKAREVDGTDYPISHEWADTPIHLVGAGVELERRTPGVAGAARMSPHALVQDYLNRVPSLWGIVSNGRELRLLRDNVSLTRQAFLAFDLEAMFSGEVYSDFALLWLLCHESRFEAPEDKPAECWLERWSQTAQSQGTRALNTLREGVERAISTLGEGFVSHPANGPLREALASGELSTADLYRELLRLVYRVIFLFVAEDRDLLHPESTPEEARSRYRDYYSMTRLRRVAERLRGGPHPDLWRGVVVVCSKLASDDGAQELGLPFLGSSLFSPGACPHLDDAALSNRDLLEAIRALGFTTQGRVLRQIDYRNMGSEELGSIYESLLELHPEVHHESGTFTLATAAGNERKTTGSYYTPTSLISALLDTALDPVLDEAAAKPDPVAAILDLNVLDPACGSGHFLVAAAHRIAKRLAAIRTDEPEPSPGAYRSALREVISRCIFGIDVNPMATELCKVSLWMEAVEPGKPLSFLEHHIVCGNSLLGTTPALLANGIPDEAFTALEGDDKATVKSLKARNRQERKGQASLFGEAAHPDLVAPIATQVSTLEATPDDSPEALRAKQQAWEALETSDALAHAKLIADAWCAAFVIEKTPTSPVLTHGVFDQLEREPDGGDPKLHDAISELADRYRFLHPSLVFPQVLQTPDSSGTAESLDQGWSGGFDVVLGNPPWDKTTVLEREFFASIPAIAGEKRSNLRKAAIAALADEDPALYMRFAQAKRMADAQGHFYRQSGRFPGTAVGELNLYPLFVECSNHLRSIEGRLGLVVKTGMLLSSTWADYCADLLDKNQVRSAFDFSNEAGWFPGVGAVERFTLLTLGESPAPIRLGFRLESLADLGGAGSTYALSRDEAVLLNPVTRSVPAFTSPRDRDLVLRVYERFPTLSSPESDWRARYTRGIDVSNEARHLLSYEELLGKGVTFDSLWVGRAGEEAYLPLYEGRLIHQYDHRFGSYQNTDPARRFGVNAPTEAPSPDEKEDPEYHVMPRYWVPADYGLRDLERRRVGFSWSLVFRDTTQPISNVRTGIAAVMGGVSFGYNLPNIVFGPPHTPEAVAALLFLATMNSFAFDYVLRQKFYGAHLVKALLMQLALPRLSQLVELEDYLVPRALELTYTSTALEPLARAVGFNGPPFGWNPTRRDELRADVDACLLRVYGFSEADCEYIFDTFPILRRAEEKKYGEFATRLRVLERLDSTIGDSS